jgi:hypothetical protein
VVKRRYSARAKLVVAIIVATALIGGGTYLYNYGLSMAGFERYAADKLNAALGEEIRKFQDENSELREALARAQRTIQMDQTAYQDLDNNLKASAQEIVKLREELNFYRNIISPADKKGGLRIQNIFIEPVGSSTTTKFRYKLVLIQALRHDRTITGNVRLEIRGMQAGEETVLRYPLPNDKPLTVNLKYFQDIEGRIELPRNFKPRQIRVSVITAAGNEAVEETYNWPQS